MEIVPIPGIRAVTAVKAPLAEERLTAVFDMEGLARAGDDRYMGDEHSRSGGQDDDVEDASDAAQDEAAPRQAGAEGDTPRRISLFA